MLLNADHWATWVTLHEYLIKYRTFTCLVLTEIVNQDLYQKKRSGQIPNYRQPQTCNLLIVSPTPYHSPMPINTAACFSHHRWDAWQTLMTGWGNVTRRGTHCQWDDAVTVMIRHTVHVAQSEQQQYECAWVTVLTATAASAISHCHPITPSSHAWFYFSGTPCPGKEAIKRV